MQQVPIAATSAGLERAVADLSDVSTDTGSDFEGEQRSSHVSGDLSHVFEESIRIDRVLVLVDWDDTILPTHWLIEEGLTNRDAEPSAVQKRMLAAVTDAAKRMLEVALELGEAVIVTNAVEGWVQLTCMRFMPALMPLVRQMLVVSARSTYEPMGHSDPLVWKCLAFDREVEREFGCPCPLNDFSKISLVAIGDSVHEHEALRRSARALPGCCTKSLIMAEKPSPQCLYEELALIVDGLDEVAFHKGDIEINVAAKIAAT